MLGLVQSSHSRPSASQCERRATLLQFRHPSVLCPSAIVAGHLPLRDVRDDEDLVIDLLATAHCVAPIHSGEAAIVEAHWSILSLLAAVKLSGHPLGSIGPSPVSRLRCKGGCSTPAEPVDSAAPGGQSR
jgi:hypothetical protein